MEGSKTGYTDRAEVYRPEVIAEADRLDEESRARAAPEAQSRRLWASLGEADGELDLAVNAQRVETDMHVTKWGQVQREQTLPNAVHRWLDGNKKKSLESYIPEADRDTAEARAYLRQRQNFVK